jgi:hypothetical protein
LKAPFAVLAGLLAAAPATLAAGEIPRAVVVLEDFTPTLPTDVPEAAPPRFVLMDDGQVYVGGSSVVLTGKLGGGEVRALERRISEVRKLPGLGGTVVVGPGERRQRLLLRKGRPIQMAIGGDPRQPAEPLRPLAELVLDLQRFHHPGLQAYQPAQYAMSAREGTLAGGCRAWPFPEPPDTALFAPRVMTAEQVKGWPTGATPASVCVGDRRYVVSLRPLLPGETP